MEKISRSSNMIHLSLEDIERALEGKSQINRIDHIRRLRVLAEYAEPGNWAWRCLENEYGFSGDYQESDAGMHRSDITSEPQEE